MEVLQNITPQKQRQEDYGSNMSSITSAKASVKLSGGIGGKKPPMSANVSAKKNTISTPSKPPNLPYAKGEWRIYHVPSKVIQL